MYPSEKLQLFLDFDLSTDKKKKVDADIKRMLKFSIRFQVHEGTALDNFVPQSISI